MKLNFNNKILFNIAGLNKCGLFLCVALCFFSFCPSFEPACHAGENNILNMATGDINGIYYPIGKGIAKAAAFGSNGSNIKINVLNSAGSEENLKWLSEGKVQLCLAQSDIVYNAYRGLENFPEKITNIRAIASLYTEAVYILIRNPLYVHNMESFAGKRISVGIKGSGTEANARAILDAAGITPNEIQLLNLDADDSIRAIRAQNLDIVFVTSGVPSEVIESMVRDKSAYFFEIDFRVLQRLSRACPFFIITTIPAGTYTNQDDDIRTLGVSALLLSRSDVDDNLLYNLTKSIYENAGLIAKYCPKAKDIKLETAFKGVSIPIAAGAKNFYKQKGLYRRQLYKYVLDILLVIFFLIILVIAAVNFRAIKYFFEKRDLAKVFLFLFSILAVGSFILYLAEHRINENYSNIFNSLWSGLITMMSLADKEPFTVVGRTTAVVMMTLGIGGVAWFTGEIASIFVQKKLMGGKIKLEKIKDHFVIVNWNDKGYGIIEQLHSGDIRKQKPIIVVSDSVESISFPEKKEYESVYLVKGQTTSEAILRRANVHHAHSVIILAEDIMNENSDASSILIILAIRKICLEKKIGKVPIVAEILDPQKIELAVHAGEEGNGNVEIVSPQHMGQRLLAQAAVSPGLTQVYKDLLTFDKNNCEIYRRKIPRSFIGKSIDDLFKLVSEHRNGGRNIIPIGIYRNGRSYINPSNRDIGSIQEQDQIYLICYGEKDLGKLDEIVDD